jgi:hypothetical protein
MIDKLRSICDSIHDKIISWCEEIYQTLNALNS